MSYDLEYGRPGTFNRIKIKKKQQPNTDVVNLTTLARFTLMGKWPENIVFLKLWLRNLPAMVSPNAPILVFQSDFIITYGGKERDLGSFIFLTNFGPF